MTSVIVTRQHRRKSPEAKTQFAASKATWRRLTSSTWGAIAATGERKRDDDADKTAEGYRQPSLDEGIDQPAAAITHRERA